MPKPTRPIKEPQNIEDLPQGTTSEDEPDSPTHVDSSDDGAAPTADIKWTVFGVKNNTATTSAATSRQHGVRKKEATETRQTSQKLRPRASKRTIVEDVDVDSDNFSTVRPKKKARSNFDAIDNEIGSHMDPEKRIVSKQKPSKAGYGKSSGKSWTSTTAKYLKREPSDSMSPAKLKVHEYSSLNSSPVKPKLSQMEDEDDLSSGLSDAPLSDKSDPPRALERRKKKPNLRQAKKNKLPDFDPEPMSQVPQFKMPDAWRDYAPVEPLQIETATGDESVVKRHLEPGMALCPMCDEQVDAALLEEFSKGERMRLAQQTKFCRLHKRRSAEKTYAEKNYPKIDWTALGSRIKPHHEYLQSLIMGTKSYFGTIHTENIRVGKNRTLVSTQEYPIPGYYGLRGMGIMTDVITETFSTLLRKQAPLDTRISGRGYTGFVQSVLVPELAVRLIQEDMSLGEDKARGVMLESRTVGGILNDEKRRSQPQTHINIHGDNDDEREEEEEQYEDEEGDEEEDEEDKDVYEGLNVHSDEDVPKGFMIQEISDSESDLSSPPVHSHKQLSANGGQSLNTEDSDLEQSRKGNGSDSDQSLASLGGSKSSKAKVLVKKQDVTKLPTRSSPYASKNTRIAVSVTSPFNDSDDSDDSDDSNLSSVLEAL